jgi:outer membrane biosynthesis protein TonB
MSTDFRGEDHLHHLDWRFGPPIKKDDAMSDKQFNFLTKQNAEILQALNDLVALLTQVPAEPPAQPETVADEEKPEPPLPPVHPKAPPEKVAHKPAPKAKAKP